MGVYDVEWGDFFSPSSVGSPASSGSSGNGSSGPPGGGPHGGFNVPDPDPEPSQPEQNILLNNQPVGIGYHPGQVDPGLAAAAGITPTLAEAQQGVTGGFDVTYPGPSQPATTTDGTATPGPAEGIGLPEIVPVIGGVGDFWNQYMSGSLLTAPWKMLKYPKAKQFSNKNDLAIIKALLEKAGKGSVNKYYEDYKDIINEGLGLETEEEGLMEFFEALIDAPNLGVEGEESQFRLDPEEFYEKFAESGEAFYATPQTTGELEKLAGIDVNMLNAQGEPLSDEFKQQIFNARNELDRQTGGQGGGGGAGIMGAVPTPFTDVNNNGILDSLEVAQATTTPAATTTAATPAEVAATTTAATTTPTPFDYSQWPQYAATNQYPWPNYVNQGLGQWPNFDYWNQIANAFPGMSQYG